MRVTIFSNEFPPGPGGIGTHAFGLAHFLVNDNVDVAVCTAARPKYDNREFDSQQPFHIRRYSTEWGGLRKLFWILVMIRMEARLHGYLVFSGSSQLGLVVPALLLTRTRTICIVHGHELSMASWIYKQVLMLALRWSTFVVAVSEFAKIRLAKEVFLREIIMIPNGVRTRDVKGQEVPRVRSPDGVLRLITVGSVTGRKGQANVVRALPELRKRFGAIEYHLVGEPSEAPQVRALAKSLDVEGHLFIHGVLTDVARDELLTRMDVCVMLSENRPDGDVEGFGIAVLEANLLGIPAIGSRGTGLEQSIVEGKSGLLIDPKSFNELAHALQTVLYSYSGYSLGAIAWAGAHSWDKIGRHYRDLID